jgi:hypothetical protein
MSMYFFTLEFLTNLVSTNKTNTATEITTTSSPIPPNFEIKLLLVSVTLS